MLESRSRKKGRRTRRISRRAGLIWLVLGILYGAFAVWFVHHPWKWIARYERSLPGIITAPLLATGYHLGNITDAFGLTGHDAIYEYDTEAPSDSVDFAGLPVRTGDTVPDDIVVLDRREFKVGYSPSLRHPLWCAYHVKPDALYPDGERPDFRRDPDAPECPNAGDYKGSGYDRGHMTPNHAMISRYGEGIRKLTFLMSNIAPQTPSLNRGVWRDVEHRIADLWTARYGEIWVVVGCIPGMTKINGVDIPKSFYQVIVAQEDMDVRAMAMIFPLNIPKRAWAVGNLVSIDELEEITGLDFLPDLPDFIQSPLEAELPSRLWPIRPADMFRLLWTSAN